MMTINDQPRSWKRFLSIKFVIWKFREHGIINSFRIVFRRGRIKTGRIILLLFDRIWYRGEKQSDVMYAFYDLEVSATTFDIVLFMVLAEQARIDAKCASLHVVIVPGSENGFKPGTRNSMNSYKNRIENFEWRLRNVLVPSCWLIPSCRQVTVCGSRNEAQVFQSSFSRHIFPKGSTIRFPQKRYHISHVIEAMQDSSLPSIQATTKSKEYIKNWIKTNAGGKKVITIALREYESLPARNSSLKDWAKFAMGLNKDIYFPVILRDTEKDFDPVPKELEGLIIFHEAVWNVELRAALYELSYLNMCVNNGPTALLIMNKNIRYLYLKIVVPSVYGCSEEYFTSLGLRTGKSFPWATPLQKIVWEDDTYEVIKREFETMCKKIESHEKTTTPTITN